MALKLTTKQMIGLCGGVTKVAKRFGVSTQAVHRWVHDDIPADKLICWQRILRKKVMGW